MLYIRRLLTTFALCLFAAAIYAQHPLQLSTQQITFNTTHELQTDSVSVTLTNTGSSSLLVKALVFSIYGHKPFSVSDSVFSLAAGDSKVLKVYFKPRHNILNNSELVFFNNSGKGHLRIDLLGQGTYSNTYYSGTQNLEGQLLKTALNTRLAQGYITLGYSGTNNGRLLMFGTLDNWQVNGREPGRTTNKVECVYTGRTLENYPLNTGTLNNAPYTMNTEHTWPQSQGSDNDPMESDVHHLYPTDGPTNSARGNKPFNWVPNPTNTYTGGSKADPTNFEPRDLQKGAVARSMLYYAVRYYNNVNVSLGYLQSQEATMRQWAALYPPDSIAIRRNNAIFAAQNNRNPFTDYPQLLDRMATLHQAVSTTPVIQGLYVSDTNVNLGSITTGQNGNYRVLVINTGNQPLQLTNIRLANQTFLLTGASTRTVSPGETEVLEVSYAGAGGAVSDTLLFGTNISATPLVKVSFSANATAGIQMGNLLLPWANSQVTLTGGSSQQLLFRWNASDAGDSVPVYHVVIYPVGDSAANPLIRISAGTDTVAGLNYMVAANTLLADGYLPGEPVDLLWQVEATAGNITAYSTEARPLQLTVEQGVGMEVLQEGKLKIYPNPGFSEGMLHVESEIPISTATVSDLLGHEWSLPLQLNGDSWTLQLPALEYGIYIARFELSNKAVVYRKLKING